MDERLAQPGLVITELRLRDGDGLPEAVAFGAVAAGQAFERIQHGARPLVFARKRGLTSGRAFEVDAGRELGMKDKSEA